MRALPNSVAMIFGASLGMAAMAGIGGCDRGDRRGAASSAPRPLAELPAAEERAAAAGTGSSPAVAGAAASAEAVRAVLPGVVPAGGADAPPAVAGCKLAADPLKLPGGKRLLAIGDVHGDLAALHAALVGGGAVNARGQWIGKDLIVVQTGDILDRGDDEQAIMDWMERLEGEARAAGGAVHWLLGNHELMNAAGDFRYVTPGGFVDFQDAPGLDLTRVVKARPEVQARAAAFLVGRDVGPYARVMAGQSTVLMVGDTVFAHAGVVGEWATRLSQMNLEHRCWLSGELPAEVLPAALTEEDSPVWTRALDGERVDCEALTFTLGRLGAARMVVGHTVQATGATSACDGKLWRIDVGLSAYYGGPIQALEITATASGKTEAKVLTGTRPAGKPAWSSASTPPALAPKAAKGARPPNPAPSSATSGR